MNKNGPTKAKFCIQSEKHPQQTTVGLCSLMEHQSLVDIAICCGNNILHAHKIVLAASSPYFREELEKNPTTEQVVITGCDFSVIRSIVEFIYCGETVVEEESLKYLVAAARLFQMKILENLSLDYQFSGEIVVLPQPQFLSKKPKYPAYPFNANFSPKNVLKPINFTINNTYKPHKVKRKFRMEAEHQACLKEAQASRLAIANLKKELASAPQSNSFIIEETCTETTVENFIPHAERQNFVEIDYNNLDNQVFLNSQTFGQDPSKNNIIQLTLPNNGQTLTTDKIKNMLGNDPNSNVEIMFKTSEGNYVTLTDEVLQNLQKDGLQYQVIDEEGRMGELQELQLMGKENIEKFSNGLDTEISKDHSCLINPNSFFNNPQHLLGNEPLDMTMENPKDLDESSMAHLDPKDIEIIPFSTVDIKPSFLAPSMNDPHDSFVRQYLNLQDENNVSFSHCIQKEESKEEIEVVNSESSMMISSCSSKQSDSPKKFSPDMFFADASTIDDYETMEHLVEPEGKKMCSDVDN